MAEAVAGHDAPWLRATGVKPLPPRRPRLFAMDLDDPDGRAAALQGSVSDALEAQRIYKPEKRPFWPHITLARVKRGRVAEPLEAAAAPGGEWRAEAVTLYRSTLRRQGAVYDALERVVLGA
jgi:2'-5' RNA ligase